MTAKYTKQERALFMRLVNKTGSMRQMDRIEGRLALIAFEKEKGTEKCQAIWASIKKRGAAKTR